MSLWAHQSAGVEYAEGLPGCLWDVGMGAGKTRMALAVILRRRGVVLVVCPKAVIPAWREEVEKFCPGDIEVVELVKGTTAAKATKLRAAVATHEAQSTRPLIVVVNYESAWRGALGAAIMRQPWSVVVADEVQRLKTAGGKASRYMARLAVRVPQRLGLSGTPCPHSPLDAYGVFRFLDRRIFGTSNARFKMRYAIFGGYEGREVIGYQNEDEYRENFYSITYKVGREVLDLPAEHHVYRRFDLPPRALRIYKQLAKTFVADLESGTLIAAHALTRLLRLQQVTSGYLPTQDDVGQTIGLEFIHNARVDMLFEILDELPPAEPVVIFCRFRPDLEAVHVAAARADRRSCELSGSRNDLREWQAGGPPVIAVQIQSGAEGIDLTRAAIAIYYSLDFSLGRYEQSLRRIHRPGQERPVTYVHLLARGTVDESIYSALRKRRNVLDEILGRRATVAA